MATFLGIDLLPDRVRGVLIRTQLRRVIIASYAEVPILAEGSLPAAAPTQTLGGFEPAQIQGGAESFIH